MTSTDPMQQLFESALSTIPEHGTASLANLHTRLQRRRRRARLVGLSGVALVALVASTVALSSSSRNDDANAVTLYPTSTTLATSAQLAADRSILVERLQSVGYTKATVTIVNGSLVIDNGPKYLANPTEMLTSSPTLFIREVLCFAGPPIKPTRARTLPTRCSPRYAITPDTPSSKSNGGFSQAPELSDPALSHYSTTTRAADKANPRGAALLPLDYNGKQRLLVGPTLLTLTPHAISGTMRKTPFDGGWLATVRLGRADARTWNLVAKESFHLILAVDVNGTVVWAPVIEPTSTTFASFGDSMELFAPTKRGALALMAVLRSGPLAVPLSTKK
jgi:preprotein translocase subunit SecD